MSEKQMKEVKAMCRAFCLANKIVWTRKFERRYIKEFFETRRMQIQSIVERRKLGIYKERRKSVRGTWPPIPVTPAKEGETD